MFKLINYEERFIYTHILPAFSFSKNCPIENQMESDVCKVFSNIFRKIIFINLKIYFILCIHKHCEIKHVRKVSFHETSVTTTLVAGYS